MAGAAPRDDTSLTKFFQGAVQIKPDSNNPFKYKPPQYANTVHKLMPSKSRTDQIEAVLKFYALLKQENTPSGLVFDPSVVTPENRPKIKELEKVVGTLGKGNSAGEVLVVQDRGTRKEYALKTVFICHFNGDEIRAWIHLADVQKAPQLYAFNLHNNEVVMKMEVLEGKTLKEVLASSGFRELLKNTEDKRCFSLLLLHGLLENFDLLQKGQFTHGDGHGGNVMVSPTLDIKLIDFGSAKLFRAGDGINHNARLKADIVNILRQFCYACTAYDFNQQSDALKAFELKSYADFKDRMPMIPEADRKWLFNVVSFVMRTVQDENQEGYADMTDVVGEVEARLPLRAELDVIKKRLAALLFPEHYRNPHHDPEFVQECEFDDADADPVFDAPELADLATLVDLKKLDADFSFE